MDIGMGEVVATATRGSWLDAIGAQWSRVRRYYTFLLPLRFSALALLIFWFALGWSDQGRDVIAGLLEKDPSGRGVAEHGWQWWFYAPLVTVLALQIWFWSRQLLRLRFAGHSSPQQYPRTTVLIPRLLGLASYAIAFGAIGRIAWHAWGDRRAPWGAMLGLSAMLVGFAAVFVVFCVLRRRWLDTNRRGNVMEQAESALGLPRSTRGVLVASTLAALLFFVAATFRPQETGTVGSSAILLVTMAFWVSFGSTLVYLAGRTKIPLLTALLVLAAIASRSNDNHVVSVLTRGVPERPTVRQAFDAWYDRLERDRPGAPHPVFIAAAEGGGIRAAYWAATVLAALSDDVPEFREHLFAISGVSGGSLGATLFDALLAKQLEGSLPPGRSVRDLATQILAHDALAPTLAAMMVPDFLQRFVPAPVLPDRARALEGGWERAWFGAVADGRLAGGFLSLLRRDDAQLPALFLNGTVVETGQRIIASNLDFTSDRLALGDYRVFADTLDLLEVAGGDIAASTAIHNSARFTYISPAGTLRRSDPPPRTGSLVGCATGAGCEHVIDGGYFENSGVTTAFDITAAIGASDRRPAPEVHVVVIRYREQHPEPLASKRWLTESLSPVYGMLNVRGARGTLAVAQIPEETGTDPIVFELLQYPDAIPLPLGWLLSAETRFRIDCQMGPGSSENGRSVSVVADELGTAVRPDAFFDKIQRDCPPVPAPG